MGNWAWEPCYLSDFFCKAKTILKSSVWFFKKAIQLPPGTLSLLGRRPRLPCADTSPAPWCHPVEKTTQTDHTDRQRCPASHSPCCPAESSQLSVFPARARCVRGGLSGCPSSWPSSRFSGHRVEHRQASPTELCSNCRVMHKISVL